LDKKDKNPYLNILIGSISIFLALVFAGLFIWKSLSVTPLTVLESIFFQFLILASSLVGSFFITKKFSEKTALDFLKPYARSSFRRIHSLYTGLLRLNIKVAKEKESTQDDSSFDKIQGIIIEQIYSSIDALEEWRDIIPEDVEEIELKAKAKKIDLRNGEIKNE